MKKKNITNRKKKGLTLFCEKDEPVEDLIYEFLEDRGISTEQAYQRDLKAFFKFTRTHFGLPRVFRRNLIFGEIRRVHVVKYKKYLETTLSNRNRTYAPNTIKRKLSTVSSFFQFLLQREIVEKNPLNFVSCLTGWSWKRLKCFRIGK